MSWGDLALAAAVGRRHGSRPAGDLARTRKARRLAILLAGATFATAFASALLFARSRPDNYDSDIMLQVTQNLVNHGSFRVTHDAFGLNTPYSSYGIGMSLLMAPPYVIAQFLGRDPISAAMDTNALLFALVVVAVLWFVRLRGATWGQALAVSALIGAGTELLPYVATGFSEVAVALTVALGLVGLEATRQHRGWGPALVGAAVGASALLRTDSLLLVALPVCTGLILLARDRRRAVLECGLAAAPWILAVAAYNQLRFGGPWAWGYSGQPFNHPFVVGLAGLTVSPSRGLIVYVPLAVVATLGLHRAWQRERIVTVVAVFLVGERMLFYSGWYMWYSGGVWGARVLVPAMPALAVGLFEVIQRLPSWRPLLRYGVYIVALCSVVVQIIGATVDYERSDLTAALGRTAFDRAGTVLQLTATPDAERRIDAVLFDPSHFPIWDEGRSLLAGENIASKELAPRPHWPAVAALLLIFLVAACSAFVLVHRFLPSSERESESRTSTRATRVLRQPMQHNELVAHQRE